jgi:hypothetical protein
LTTPTPGEPSGPGCSFSGCTAAPLVQWQRRPTKAELAPVVAAEQDRRDQALATADPDQPAPEFGPLPTASDTALAVFACGPHAISMDLAALVHAADCLAPEPTVLPGCNCTPEPASAPEPMHTEPRSLPDHWR